MSDESGEHDELWEAIGRLEKALQSERWDRQTECNNLHARLAAAEQRIQELESVLTQARGAVVVHN